MPKIKMQYNPTANLMLTYWGIMGKYQKVFVFPNHISLMFLWEQKKKSCVHTENTTVCSTQQLWAWAEVLLQSVSVVTVCCDSMPVQSVDAVCSEPRLWCGHDMARTSAARNASDPCVLDSESTFRHLYF